VAALALHHGQPPVGDLHVGEPQAQHLAAAQPASSIASTIARSRCVGSAATSRSASDGDKILGRVRGTRTSGTVRDDLFPPWRRVDKPRGTGLAPHRSVPAGHQVGVKARHRRQPPGDRPRRQARLPVNQPHHAAVAALVSQELEHVRRRDLDRVPGDHGEERLQVESDRPISGKLTTAVSQLSEPVSNKDHLCIKRSGCGLITPSGHRTY
jgi:hypothetical protein